MIIDITTILSLALGLMCLSFLVEPRNRLFRFCEVTLLGTSIGIVVTEGYWVLLNNTIVPMINGYYLYIIPVVLGFMFMLRFIPKGVLYARIPLAFFFAIQIPLFLTRLLSSEVIKQSLSTIINPLNFENFIFIIAVIFSLMFFYWSAKPKGIYGVVSRIGLYFWMIDMAVIWVTTGMKREEVLISRIIVLLRQLGLIL